MLQGEVSKAFATAKMLSSDGKCHTFDSRANGYCRGEGCGTVVLKRLSDAVRDGDGIYTVIKGSAVMQDGQSASLTAPNGRMQEELMRAALRDACLEPADVKYFEAHGTGTPLGDPIETSAIAEVYGKGRAEENPLYISSAKSNIGHLEAAAGMAGLMSAMLTLQYSMVPPNAQLQDMNSKVAASVEGLPLLFPTIATPLSSSPLEQAAGTPRAAVVSSFGYSGTIAHVVLVEPPETHRRSSGSSHEAIEESKEAELAESLGHKRFDLGRKSHRLLQHPFHCTRGHRGVL